MSLPLEALLDGKYEILDKIAEGGIGSIYKVRHKLLEEVRVIKVLRSQVADREDLHRRLMQEAKTAIRLEHPSIARLYDLTLAEDGTAYIVMEFIDGVSLDSLLAATGPPSVELCLEVAKQSLNALGYLHESGFIHRDISPDNLMLTRAFDTRLRVKMIDLGIAKDLAQETGVTAVGTFLGKVKYCAPELFKEAGVAQLDQRSDNYSLAITLYELLTGHHPFTGETFEELAAGHLFHAPTSFDETDPEGRVPENLREILLRAMAKDPDDRPTSAQEFAVALNDFVIDEKALAKEFERTVGATTRFLSKFEKYSTGSTQDHINEQFGFEKTGVLEANSAEPVTEDAPPHATDKPSSTQPTIKTEAVLTVVPKKHKHKKTPSSRKKTHPALWAALLLAVPTLAATAWFLLKPQAAPLATTLAVDDTGFPFLAAAERFDPEATGDLINAPEVPSEILDDEGAEAADQAAEPVREIVVASAAAAGSQPAATEPTPLPAATSPPRPLPADAERQAPLLRPGPGVIAPKLIGVLAPTYPRPDKKEVVIVVSALISHTGRVLTATVKSGPSFKRRYREAAVAEVEAARFTPAAANGAPGKMWVDVDVVFKPEA